MNYMHSIYNKRVRRKKRKKTKKKQNKKQNKQKQKKKKKEKKSGKIHSTIKTYLLFDITTNRYNPIFNLFLIHVLQNQSTLNTSR